VTALLIMAGSYLIIRHVIVKPLKHLKGVSDAIYAGQLDVRSEIATGDEFEDLSAAFNRMLRNLVSMQERLKASEREPGPEGRQLARTNMELFESNRIKSDFLATMSHELRTPLNSIIGFSDVLISSAALTEKQKRWVENIQGSGKQLLVIINDVLDLSKMEAGQMQLHRESFALPELVESVATAFRPQAEKKNIDLKQFVAPDLPPLEQDAGKLRQIVTNLLSNAIKFTPEGGRVVLRADGDGDRVRIQVSDTGVGIAPEEQDRIFEKFRQAANRLPASTRAADLACRSSASCRSSSAATWPPQRTRPRQHVHRYSADPSLTAALPKCPCRLWKRRYEGCRFRPGGLGEMAPCPPIRFRGSC